MKKINILLFFSVCYFFSQAQISLTRANMPTAGWVNPCQEDTIRNAVAAVNFGSSGTHQVYNFGSLAHQVLDSAYYYAPSTTQPSGNPQHTAVPGANLAAFYPPTTYLMGVDTTNFFAYDGLQVTVYNSVVISNYNVYDNNSVDTFYKFPCSYGQTFHGDYAGSVKILATNISSYASLLGWDSIKVYIGATYIDSIDGWGTVTTPVGTYNCLRQKRVETDSTYYYYNSSANGPYTLMPLSENILGTNYTLLAANPSIATTTSYSYLAKETKGAVISFSYDSISQPITATWSALPPFPAAKFTADTGAAGLVTFLDSSSYPTTYSWNFGDGSSVNTSAAPTHTYTANGTYDVCLTVTNASGDSTICDSVHISNISGVTPPVAQITPSGNDTICPGASIILRAQTGTGYTFKWSTGATADSIIVTTGGSYTVKVYHSGDSATSSATVVVVNTPNTSLTLTGPASFCLGDSTELSAAAGLTYHWSTGASTSSIWVKTTGSYTVTVTNGNHCSAVSSPEAMTANQPQVDNISQSGPFLTSENETSYQWYENGTLINGAITQSLIAHSNGVYSVHYTDGNGCTSISDSVTVTDAGINDILSSDYKIYPNPASDQIQVDFSHVDQATLNSLSEIVIYDLLGEKLKSLPLTQTSITVKDLSDGVYLIGVVDKNQNRKILGKFDVLK